MKIVVSRGGAARPDAFSFVVNGAVAQQFTRTGLNVLTVLPGTYTVLEANASGYTTVYDSCTAIVVAAGETATCTITNIENPPAPATIIVQKVVVINDRGTAVASDFAFVINGLLVPFDADGSVSITVDIGTAYSVTEPHVDGYSTTYVNCTALVLRPGETVTCTITNDDDAPPVTTLIVRKVVVNDNGGTAAAADFSFVLNGVVYAFDGDGTVELSVNPGTYTVIEPTAAGYTTSYANCTNVVVAAGATVTCTITNDDRPATLIVHKVVVNDNGGTMSAADFEFAVGDGSINGGVLIGFPAGGTSTLTVGPGTYSVTEPAVDGYETDVRRVHRHHPRAR